MPSTGNEIVMSFVFPTRNYSPIILLKICKMRIKYFSDIMKSYYFYLYWCNNENTPVVETFKIA